MKKLLITQRVIENPTYKERRDAIDQNWTLFLEEAGYIGIALPNQTKNLNLYIDQFDISGILLTGGNDIDSDAPERDTLEKELISIALDKQIPLLGVCRGMQIIHTHFGGELVPVEGHVSASQKILINGQTEERNSYHNFGITEELDQFNTWSQSEDGVIKAISHKENAIQAIMWHPERHSPFLAEDIKLFQNFFK